MTNLFDIESVATSDLDINAIISYSAIHCGLTPDLVESYSDYPSVDDMVKELKEKRIGFDFQKNKEYDWDKIGKRKNKTQLLTTWLAVHLQNNLGDISKIEELPYADFITYSSPCTDYSQAGRQEGAFNTCNKCGHKFNPFDYDVEERYNCPVCGSDDIQGTRSGLLKEVERLLITSINNNKAPKYLMLENVSALVSKKFKPDFDAWCRRLENLGYNNHYKLLNGKDCGTPQNRLRIFMISIRKDIDTGKFTFPIPFDNGLRLKDILEKNVDEKYYLSQEVQDRFQVTDETFTKNIIGTTKPECRTIGQRDLVYQQDSTMGALVATDYKQPKQLIDIDDTNELRQIGQIYGFGKEKNPQAGRIYDKDYISPTMDSCTGGNRQVKITESNKKCKIRIRKLTPTECWRLMNFEDSDIYKAITMGVSDSKLYMQAGNSIICNCIKLLAEHLYKAQYDSTYVCYDESFQSPTE